MEVTLHQSHEVALRCPELEYRLGKGKQGIFRIGLPQQVVDL